MSRLERYPEIPLWRQQNAVHRWQQLHTSAVSAVWEALAAIWAAGTGEFSCQRREGEFMDENEADKEKPEDGNRMSHENAEERGENTVPPEESPCLQKKGGQ
jgi:hypothetical protein